VRQLIQRIAIGFWASLLVMGLTACSPADQALGGDVVQQAIAMQVWQTQQALSQQLKLVPPEPEQIAIRHVVVTAKSPLKIEKLPAYKLQGTYDFTLTLPKRRVSQRDNAFEIYIQSQPEGKTWRLAQRDRDEDGNEQWVTQMIERPS
jgi:hypothetical protein